MVCCLAASIAFTAFAFGVFVLKDPAQTSHARTTRSNPHLSAGALSVVWTIFKKRDILLIVFITFFSTFMGTTVEAGLPLILVREQQAPIWQVVVVFGVIAVETPLIIAFL